MIVDPICPERSASLPKKIFARISDLINERNAK